MQQEDILTKTPEIHEDFRLWLTVEITKAFPIGLLQMSIKVRANSLFSLFLSPRVYWNWIQRRNRWIATKISALPHYLCQSDENYLQLNKGDCRAAGGFEGRALPYLHDRDVAGVAGKD